MVWDSSTKLASQWYLCGCIEGMRPRTFVVLSLFSVFGVVCYDKPSHGRIHAGAADAGVILEHYFEDM